MLVPYIFLVICILFTEFLVFTYDDIRLKRSVLEESDKDERSAMDVLIDNLKDPLVTSRAYFTEPLTGPTGDFTGYLPVSQDDWLHRFSHEETENESDEYDDVRSLI